MSTKTSLLSEVCFYSYFLGCEKPEDHRITCSSCHLPDVGLKNQPAGTSRWNSVGGLEDAVEMLMGMVPCRFRMCMKMSENQGSSYMIYMNDTSTQKDTHKKVDCHCWRNDETIFSSTLLKTRWIQWRLDNFQWLHWPVPFLHLEMLPTMSFSQAAIYEGCDQDNADRWRPAFSVANLKKGISKTKNPCICVRHVKFHASWRLEGS